MPKMNGLEATRIIRNTVKYLPIIALTSNDEYKSECYEAGMDELCTKTMPK